MTKPLQRKSSEPEIPWRPEPKKYGVWALYIAFALGLIIGSVVTGWVAIDAFTHHPPAAHPASYAPSSLPIAAQKTQDDGFGKCEAFTHYHATPEQVLSNGGYDAGVGHNFSKWFGITTLDGLCHDDKTDAPITERPKLPKPAPQFKPGKEPLV